jgi:hypothetical protein
MDNGDRKDQPGPTKVEDLERVVRVRKYRHCAAEYLKLAKEPNTMRVVGDRYLRIAAYYAELADTEDTNEGEAKLIDAAPQLVSHVTNADRLRRVAQDIDRLGEPDLGDQLAAKHPKAPAGDRPKRASRFLSPFKPVARLRASPRLSLRGDVSIA